MVGVHYLSFGVQLGYRSITYSGQSVKGDFNPSISLASVSWRFCLVATREGTKSSGKGTHLEATIPDKRRVGSAKSAFSATVTNFLPAF